MNQLWPALTLAKWNVTVTFSLFKIWRGGWVPIAEKGQQQRLVKWKRKLRIHVHVGHCVRTSGVCVCVCVCLFSHTLVCIESNGTKLLSRTDRGSTGAVLTTCGDASRPSPANGSVGCCEVSFGWLAACGGGGRVTRGDGVACEFSGGGRLVRPIGNGPVPGGGGLMRGKEGVVWVVGIVLGGKRGVANGDCDWVVDEPAGSKSEEIEINVYNNEDSSIWIEIHTQQYKITLHMLHGLKRESLNSHLLQ